MQPFKLATAALGRRSAGDAMGMLLFAGVVGLLVGLIAMYVVRFHGSWDDSLNYLAAGERLNDGHQLYRVVAGDRPIDPQMQAGYAVPLVSPPFVAVVWRPLAALGDPVGVAIWWLTMAVSIGTAIAILHRWSPLVAGFALVGTILPLVFQVTGGNMNAALILGAVAAWWAFATGRPALAGGILGVALVAKGIPAPLCLWILVSGGSGAWRGFGAGFASALVVSFIGAGIQAHLDYASFALGASADATGFSLAGLSTGYLGVPPAVARFLPFVMLGVGSAATVVVRRRPSIAFAIAAVTMVFGFNGVHFHSYALLLVAAAPLAWAFRERSPSRALVAGPLSGPVARATTSAESM